MKRGHFYFAEKRTFLFGIDTKSDSIQVTFAVDGVSEKGVFELFGYVPYFLA